MNKDDKLFLAEFVFEAVTFVILVIGLFKDIAVIFSSPKEELLPALFALAVSIIPIMALIVMMNPNRVLVNRSKKSSNQVRGKFIRAEKISVSDNKEIEAGVYKYTLAGVESETRFIWTGDNHKFPDKLDLYVVDGKPVRTSNALLMAEGDRKKVITIQIVLAIAISISVLGCLIFGFSTIN